MSIQEVTALHEQAREAKAAIMRVVHTLNEIQRGATGIVTPQDLIEPVKILAAILDKVVEDVHQINHAEASRRMAGR